MSAVSPGGAHPHWVLNRENTFFQPKLTFFNDDIHLQRFQEAKGAQTSTTWHQTESGVVEELLVVKPVKKRNYDDVFIPISLWSYADATVIH